MVHKQIQEYTEMVLLGSEVKSWNLGHSAVVHVYVAHFYAVNCSHDKINEYKSIVYCLSLRSYESRFYILNHKSVNKYE